MGRRAILVRLVFVAAMGGAAGIPATAVAQTQAASTQTQAASTQAQAASTQTSAASSQTQDASAFVGRPVASITIEVEGQPDTSPDLAALIVSGVGRPLSAGELRTSIVQLYAAKTFDEITVVGRDTPGGVALVFEVVPQHEIDQIEFVGTTGVPAGDLRQRLLDTFNGFPPRTRLDAARSALRGFLAEEGYQDATIASDVVRSHAPHRSTLRFTIEAGPRARIRQTVVHGTSPLAPAALIDQSGAAAGQPYRPREINIALDAIVADLRQRGYYDAYARQSFTPVPGSTDVDVVLEIDAGSLVELRFKGDPLPPGNPDDLVPIRRERSADEALLEDAERRIELALKRDGYWHAQAPFVQTTEGDHETITFTIARGPRYLLRSVDVTGNQALDEAAVDALLNLTAGAPFDATRVDAGVARVRARYLSRGFVDVKVTPVVTDLGGPAGGDAQVAVRVQIVEGPAVQISSVTFSPTTAVAEAALRAKIASAPGEPFVEARVAADRDALQIEYANRGFDAATIDPNVTFSADRSAAAIRFDIKEGPQTIVDQIIVIGNHRTSTQTILAQMALQPGHAAGQADREESLRRLRDLGFRRVRIDEIARATHEGHVDLVVTVEEAPSTTVAYGGGVQGGRHPRAAVGGGTVDRVEFAPRGSFDIERRNLFGKNRSIDLASSLTLRRRDAPFDPVHDGKGFGFSEYHVTGTFTEPRVRGWEADAHLRVTIDQAPRTTFNFLRKAAIADIDRRLTPRVSVVGQYSLESTRLFDANIPPDQQLAIDRLFPQVRLSTFSGTILRDTRNDVADPDRGTFMSADGALAARALGSQVGFVKTFLQASIFHKLPAARRVVFAADARVGLARGFSRTVILTDANHQPVLGPDGQPLTTVVDEVPASERFFAGGATTIRGFQADRLGVPEVLNADGLSNGGNGVVILNGELRAHIWRDFGGVGFIDSGNVFARAADISVPAFRTTVGFGLRYKSFIGPMRFDLGFKVGALRSTDSGRSEFHFSIGEAF